jgi:glycosyltransferase involved in cell wall biosynthesis
MRVAYLASRYPEISHTFIRREVLALRERGVQVDTFTLRAPDRVLSDEDRAEQDSTWAVLPRSAIGILTDHLAAFVTRPGHYVDTLAHATHHRMPGLRSLLWSTFHFAEAIILAQELKRRGVRHLHSHFSNAGGDVGMLASRFLGISWSVTLHGSADFDAPTRSLLAEKIAAAQFTACVSHFGRALAMRLGAPVDWDKLVVVRCGVDLTRLPMRQERVRPTRSRILSIGRLSPEKGFLGLVDAFAMVVARGTDCELRILGEGDERQRIEARIAEHGLQDRCWLPGAASEQQVQAELQDADVFAMSSFMEGLPVALMEAMAIGVPVVAPRVAGIPELIEHGSTGLLFTPAVWTDLATCLHRMLTDTSAAQQMAGAGRRVVESEFDVRVAVVPLIEALARVAHEP